MERCEHGAVRFKKQKKKKGGKKGDLNGRMAQALLAHLHRPFVVMLP